MWKRIEWSFVKGWEGQESDHFGCPNGHCKGTEWWSDSALAAEFSTANFQRSNQWTTILFIILMVFAFGLLAGAVLSWFAIYSYISRVTLVESKECGSETELSFPFSTTWRSTQRKHKRCSATKEKWWVEEFVYGCWPFERCYWLFERCRWPFERCHWLFERRCRPLMCARRSSSTAAGSTSRPLTRWSLFEHCRWIFSRNPDRFCEASQNLGGVRNSIQPHAFSAFRFSSMHVNWHLLPRWHGEFRVLVLEAVVKGPGLVVLISGHLKPRTYTYIYKLHTDIYIYI